MASDLALSIATTSNPHMAAVALAHATVDLVQAIADLHEAAGQAATAAAIERDAQAMFDRMNTYPRVESYTETLADYDREVTEYYDLRSGSRLESFSHLVATNIGVGGAHVSPIMEVLNEQGLCLR